MKRAHSDNNLESDDNMNDAANSVNSGGGGSNASGGNQHSNNNNRGQKRNRNEEQIRLLIPSRFAGGIIGKGGQNIKRLRQEFHANINVEDCPGPERTVNISAPELNNALKVVEDILHNSLGEADNEIDLRLLIHQSLAGCVIGKGGGKIKEIRDKVGCRILKVFSNMCPQSSDRVVQCVGKSNECMDALNDILVLIKEVPIKGSIQNYDPINYDDYSADKYGGFGGDGSGGGGGGNRNNNNRGSQGGGGGVGGGQGGRNNRGDRQVGGFERRDNNNRNFNRRNDGGGGGGGGGRGSVGVGGGAGNNNMRDRERNSFINPWASNQPSMGSNSFDGPNFNQFGNNGLGGGMGYNSLNSPNNGGSANSLLNGFSGFGNNPNLGSNNSFDNSLGGNNGPVFGMNNSLGGNNNLPNSMGNNGQNDEGRETTQVTIPKDLAGAIIGKAGTRIRRIRMESNAFITIDEPAQGSTDRIITISGTARQIQLAQYLLQQSVREHRRN